MESNSFIPPDYSEAEENEFPGSPVVEEDEDDDIFDEDTPEDLGIEDDPEEFELEKRKANEAMSGAVTTNFGTPGNTGSPFGVPSSTPSWGSQGGAVNPWGNRPYQPSSTPWGSPGTGWQQSTGVSVSGQRINREKKVIFCDFIDCVVEAYGANGKPGLRPRDIYDLRPRFEVWDKLAAFNPEKIFFIIPASLIPESANGINAWNVTLSYFCVAVSSYLRIPYDSCQIIKQVMIGQSKSEVVSAVLRSGIRHEDAIMIGVYSGASGLSDVDQVAAKDSGIDYLDLGTLLGML